MIHAIPEPYEETTEASDSEIALFEAILEPHRSLSPRGFIILMAAIAAVSFAAGTAFVLMGAWPVLGFFALDAMLVTIAFRSNFHSARIYETVRLTESALTVIRVMADGQALSWRFQPYWLKIGMDDPPMPESELLLSSHGKALAIGEFLTPDERLDLAEILRGELYKLREVRHPSTA